MFASGAVRSELFFVAKFRAFAGVVTSPGLSIYQERSQMVDNAKSEKARLDEVKKQLLKTARMYAMCRKAEVAEPLDVAALALAAFEDMNMKQAVVFVQSNEQNIKDLAWAFENSNSPEEFEHRLKEIKSLSSEQGKQ
jgi:anion-transporting  ArsA/GET3 family ATPase